MKIALLQIEKIKKSSAISFMKMLATAIQIVAITIFFVVDSRF